MDMLKLEIEKVLNDRQSGSILVLNKLISRLESFSKRNFNSKKKQELALYLDSLRTGFNDFPVVLHFLISQVQFLNNNKIQDLSKFLYQYKKRWRNTGIQIAKKTKKLIDLFGKTILLHSFSGTIMSIFESYPELAQSIRIIQTESRPNLEGRKQAAVLAKLGFKVLLIPDLGIGRHLKEVNLILLGADRICPEFFVNKNGTLVLSILAKENQIPLYVLTDSRKFISGNSCQSYLEKPKESSELWKNPPKNVHVENYYFEHIPNSLVTGFVTEKGWLEKDFFK